MSHLFLTEGDLDGFRRWKYSVVDTSFTTIYLGPFWNWIVQYVPKECAPNVLTLAGFLSAIQAYASVALYRHSHPGYAVSAFTCFAWLYFNLDSLDGKHARNTKNSSALGELFDHACDNLTTAMATVALFWLLGVEDERLLWVITQATSLSYCHEHLIAYAVPDKTIRFGFFTGPGEIIIYGLTVVNLHYLGLMSGVWAGFVDLVSANININWPTGALVNYEIRSAYVAELVIISLLCFALVRMFLYIMAMPKEHALTRGVIFLFVVIRAMPGVKYMQLLHTFGGDFGGGAYQPLSAAVSASTGMGITKVLTDGMFISIMSSDLILGKMASRNLHPLLPCMAAASNFSIYIAMACMVIYYVTVFHDICVGLNLPLLSPVVNVYCDGVYDMLHLGHMKAFENALRVSGGHRLYVGVISDAAATDYKRPPIMREQERYDTVRHCKYVYEVIEDCPIVATKEFIDKHNIHIYAVGEEYVDNPDDHYYRVPRELKMLKKTPRSHGVSTTELINRILARGESIHEKKPIPKKRSNSVSTN